MRYVSKDRKKQVKGYEYAVTWKNQAGKRDISWFSSPEERTTFVRKLKANPEIEKQNFGFRSRKK